MRFHQLVLVTLKTSWDDSTVPRIPRKRQRREVFYLHERLCLSDDGGVEDWAQLQGVKFTSP